MLGKSKPRFNKTSRSAVAKSLACPVKTRLSLAVAVRPLVLNRTVPVQLCLGWKPEEDLDLAMVLLENENPLLDPTEDVENETPLLNLTEDISSPMEEEEPVLKQNEEILSDHPRNLLLEEEADNDDEFGEGNLLWLLADPEAHSYSPTSPDRSPPSYSPSSPEYKHVPPSYSPYSPEYKHVPASYSPYSPEYKHVPPSNRPVSPPPSPPLSPVTNNTEKPWSSPPASPDHVRPWWYPSDTPVKPANDTELVETEEGPLAFHPVIAFPALTKFLENDPTSYMSLRRVNRRFFANLSTFEVFNVNYNKTIETSITRLVNRSFYNRGVDLYIVGPHSRDAQQRRYIEFGSIANPGARFYIDKLTGLMLGCRTQAPRGSVFDESPEDYINVWSTGAELLIKAKKPSKRFGMDSILKDATNEHRKHLMGDYKKAQLRACCDDDILWKKPYAAKKQSVPAKLVI